MNGFDRAAAADEVLIDALAAGLTHAEAGVLAGVSSKTVQRRLHDGVFAARVGRDRSMRLEEISGQLTAMAPTAIGVLRECMAVDKPLVRLRAAEATLLWLTRVRREVDFELRLARLESTDETDTDDSASS